MYSLYPNDLIGDRRKIESEEDFRSIKDVYLNGDPNVAPPELYVWPVSESDESPEKLPARKGKNNDASSVTAGHQLAQLQEL